MAIEESISEEPDVGNPQVRFCEGHAPPYTKFIKFILKKGDDMSTRQTMRRLISEIAVKYILYGY